MYPCFWGAVLVIVYYPLGMCLHIGVGFWRCLFNFDRQCKSLSVWNGQPTVPRFFCAMMLSDYFF